MFKNKTPAKTTKATPADSKLHHLQNYSLTEQSPPCWQAKQTQEKRDTDRIWLTEQLQWRNTMTTALAGNFLHSILDSTWLSGTRRDGHATSSCPAKVQRVTGATLSKNTIGNKIRRNRSHLHGTYNTELQQTETVKRIRFVELATLDKDQVSHSEQRQAHQPVGLKQKCQ